MRQALVQSEYISSIDKPFNNIRPFIFKPLQKRRVLVLSIIAAWCNHVTWWKFPSLVSWRSKSWSKSWLDHAT